jgi:DNA ligase D-like protein (predicted 3'-phosphoesterase)
MPNRLDEYRRKRDFDQTSEPADDGRPSAGDPIYVIQRHDASTLHYDVRLEVDGVLKSWAVPKGPPERPGERRLAVPTEDHPMAYADFAGRIPKGQYGAGRVEIWDRGTYRNLRAEGEESLSMAEALNEGKVEVYLQGDKLDGPFALIRVATDEDEEPRWLMLKMKAQPEAKDE